ncbi:hypothetical protein A374_02434 [Fictibacillus macauensis ZFHKF-1]|uniref:ABM domain-containing protein n=1 Tax=Fictibacillus macauensis ZFHKF-1 TaxID=1196324 RepID=I8AMZ0_9BACL|nr:putative quinol monooxygenase [Fictibacillus macauensis]EIT87074.1 hypothetical protein A374_02434 [Fictibacillus macauensis ZFHKF-1]
MLIIHAKSFVKPEFKEEYLEKVNVMIAGSRKEEGNVSYSLFQDTENENAFMMVEVWRDAEAVALHEKSDHFVQFVTNAKEFFSAPLELKVFAGEEAKLS